MLAGGTTDLIWERLNQLFEFGFGILKYSLAVAADTGFSPEAGSPMTAKSHHPPNVRSASKADIARLGARRKTRHNKMTTQTSGG